LAAVVNFRRRVDPSGLPRQRRLRAEPPREYALSDLGGLPGPVWHTEPSKPILLMAHLDVVEALASVVRPLQADERDGFFYGRGSGDDKFMAATFVTNLIVQRG
jgi:acetylornithine deacetylase/succinyl-diaminopimelate desuccinylase-like protein